jgi:hypothetical protein
MTTKTSKMQPGDTYVVTGGKLKGRTVTVVDPTIFPDTDMVRRRKITVDFNGEHVYLLPRLLESPSTYNAQPSNVVSLPPQGYSVPHPTEANERIVIPGNITDVNDPRLDPWRPDPSILKGYVSRNVPNGQSDTDFLLSFYDKKDNVLLVGDTQAGKTLLVQVLAVLAGKRTASGKPLPVFTLSGSNGVTDFDLFGQPTAFTTPDGQERLVWLPGVCDLAARAGGVLYLDEVNMMPERVTSSLHPLTDHRRAFVNRQRAVRFEHEGTEVFMPDVVNASDDLWIVGTMNPGYKGAGSLNEAFTNRFRWIPWGYDEAVEKKLIPSASVRLLGQALREARSGRSITTPVGTSALSRLCEDVEVYGVDTALWMFKAMFSPQEQPKVEAIIQDRSITMLLNDEQVAKNGPAPTIDPVEPF